MCLPQYRKKKGRKKLNDEKGEANWKALSGCAMCASGLAFPPLQVAVVRLLKDGFVRLLLGLTFPSLQVPVVRFSWIVLCSWKLLKWKPPIKIAFLGLALNKGGWGSKNSGSVDQKKVQTKCFF